MTGHNHVTIAITGIGCRLPGGANSPASFWELLEQGRDGIIEVPEDRWNVDAFFDPRPNMPGKMYVGAGGFLRQRIDEFDALFFGISPREAVYLDPQQRLLLEVAWEAVEDAGLVPEALAGSDTGVYIGGFMVDNMLTQFSPLNRDQIGPHTAVSSTLSILSNRLSYVFDFRGPSITIDTACSSSLVAVHQACQALWRGECALALAGGVNVMYRPETLIAMCKGGFLAPDGRSKSFDARADGYGRGEGAGIIVLKPAVAALRDGDDIYALIRGTGVNQDGRTDGITVPNPAAQEMLIRRVCADSGVEPSEIRYVEAHGTGTPVGDPLESAALGAVVGAGRAPDKPCLLGSVKANIGHLEAAAGVAGLIKAALCLKHRSIPPIANLATPNPNIPFAKLGLRLVRELEPMPAGSGPALAAVNSFGYGGTNAHVILQEAPDSPLHNETERRTADQEAESGPHLLPISARSKQALKALAQAYLARFEDSLANALPETCYSASVHRSHHDHRLAVFGRRPEAMAETLRLFVENGHAPGAAVGTADTRGQKPVFVFTGMGPQWWGMGRELLECEPVFRDFAETCDRLFECLAGWSILKEMTRSEEASRITETQIAQPANFVLQAGLTALWRSKGIEPAAILGHSVGEVSAAYVAGVLSLEDAVRVAYHRSRIQKKAAGLGTMLAVGLAQADVASFLRAHQGSVSLAAINSPTSLTLSGETASLETIAAELTRKGVFNRFLQVEVAYHSPYMAPLGAELLQSLAGLSPQTARVPLYSTVSGRLAEDGDYGAQYWFRNIREPVHFAKAMEAIIAAGHRVFLEVGPHPVLSTSLKQCLSHDGIGGHVLTSLRRGQPERATMVEALAGLYACGSPIDWKGLYPNGGTYRRLLPTYPWQRESYWRETNAAVADRLERPDHALLGRRVPAPNPSWESRINRNLLPYVNDHQVETLIVLPGAAYVELGFAVHHAITGRTQHLLEDLEFSKALIVDPDDEPLLHITYDEGRRAYTVYSRPRDAGPWTLHARGRLSFLSFDHRDAAADLSEIQARCTETIMQAAHYAAMHERGLHYGPYFNGVRHLLRARDGGEVLAFIEGHEALSGADHRNRLHPTLLDASFQALLATISMRNDANVYVPVRIREARLHHPPEGGFWCHGRLSHHDGGALEGDILLYDERGEVFADFRGIQAQALTKSVPAAAGWTLDDHLYQFDWRERARTEARIEPGRFILFMDETGVGKRLARDLMAMGARDVIRVSAGAAFDTRGTDYILAPDDKTGFQRLLTETMAEPVAGIVHLWSLDALEGDGDPVGGMNMISGLNLIQALTETGRTVPLFFVTQQAHPVGAVGVAITQAPLASLVRVAVNEYAEHRFRMIDIDGSADASAALVHEILADDEDDDVALRDNRRFVSRFERRAQTDFEGGCDGPTAGGRASSGMPAARRRRESEAGEVEVAIRQAATLTDASVAAVGIVTHVGPAETRLQPGQEVLLYLDGPPRPFALLPGHLVHPVPKQRTIGSALARGLTLAPLAVAYHALHRIARLRKGDRILIAGAGALSLAAVQVAQSMGALVYAAATTADQQANLQNLGIDPVPDCSSLSFVDRISAEIEGRDVDVVFNMHGGELADRTLRLLAPFGRFLDLGHAFAGETNTAFRLRHNQILASIDIREVMADDPAAFERLLAEIVDEVDAGRLIPSLPLTPTPPESGVDGQAATDRGVIDFGDAHLEDITEATAAPPIRLDPDGTYLVTGGFGGLGLELARWLADRGVRNLVLVSRRGASTPGAPEAVRELEARGVRVHAAALDIAEGDQVERLLGEIAATMPPLQGIFHTAAVLDDGPIYTIRPQQLANVLRPKALGAWQLHRQTRGMRLSCFVMFSSIASLLGSPGQATYVAANAFLDALAHHRRQQGLAAISVNLGAISRIGMAARHEGVEHYLRRVGVGSFTPAQALSALERILTWNPVEIGVADVDWRLWGGTYPAWAASPRYRHLMPAPDDAEAAEAGRRGALRKLDPQQRRTAVTEILIELLSEILRLPPEKVDPGLSLLNMGIDSLMAMETQVAIEKRIGLKVSVLELMKGNTMAELARQMADLLEQPPEAAEQQPEPEEIRPAARPSVAEPPMAGAPGILAGIDELSDDEVEDEIRRLVLEDEEIRV